MELLSDTGWREHILAGSKYLKTARNGTSRPSVFNNELIFQLTAMAIEKLIVGLSQFYHQLPMDHTLSGLVEGLATICPMEEELAGQIRAIEQIDNMCALTPVRREGPKDEEVLRILDVGQQVADFTMSHLPEPESGFGRVP